MKLSIHQMMVLACVLGLGGCSSLSERMALNTAARDKITSTEVVAPVLQNEIYVFVPPSTVGASAGAAFGVLGAVIGSAADVATNAANAKAATAAVKPLRDAMVDYEFDARFTDHLQKSLTQVSWLKVDGVRVVKDGRKDTIEAAITKSGKGAVLLVAADYQLNADASTLTVALKANLFSNSDALKTFVNVETADAKSVAHPGNALYRTKLVRTFDAPNTKSPGVIQPSRDDNLRNWAADKGKLTRASLDSAIETLCGELAEDIQKGPEVAPAGGAKPTAARK